MPLGISLVTIVGVCADAANDAYRTRIITLNVITILGLGLSIDYALLSINRFREELKLAVWQGRCVWWWLHRAALYSLAPLR